MEFSPMKIYVRVSIENLLDLTNQNPWVFHEVSIGVSIFLGFLATQASETPTLKMSGPERTPLWPCLTVLNGDEYGINMGLMVNTILT